MNVYTANPPGFAKQSSTFKTDPRCEAVAYVTGDSYDEVYAKVKEIWKIGNHIDYDVNWSTEGETFVGVVVRDL